MNVAKKIVEENELDWKILGPLIKEKISEWSGYSKFPLKGEILEEQLVKCLEDLGLEPGWEPGSHKPGADITDYSIKSGQIKAGVLSISSFRTTKLKSLQEKLDYFDGEGKNYNYYFVLVRTDNDKLKVRNYRALIIPSDFICANNFTWKGNYGQRGADKGKLNGWKTDQKHGISLSIAKSMSDQFWIYIKEDSLNKNIEDGEIKKLCDIDIPYDQLGTTHEIREK